MLCHDKWGNEISILRALTHQSSHCTGTKNYGNYARPQGAEDSWRFHNTIISGKIGHIRPHYKGCLDKEVV